MASEIKFACPVCGQHITVDLRTCGPHVECPTCFRQLVVPQASAGDSKLVITATQVGSPRPISLEGVGGERRPQSNRNSWRSAKRLLTTAALLVAAGGAVYWYETHRITTDPQPEARLEPPKPRKPRPGWNLDLTQAVVPDAPAAGRIRGKPFKSERATFRGSVLSLRQGQGWPPESGVSVALFSDRVGGKTLEVLPERAPPVPRITVRWTNENGQATNDTIRQGYALRLVFEEPANGRIRGKVFLALPDSEQSFVAGNFDAEIVQGGRPKRSPASTTNITVKP